MHPSGAERWKKVIFINGLISENNRRFFGTVINELMAELAEITVRILVRTLRIVPFLIAIRGVAAAEVVRGGSCPYSFLADLLRTMRSVKRVINRMKA